MKLFNEIKQSIGNTPIENQSKKTKFIKALIRIFSILLNANLNSAKKISSYKTKSKTCFKHIARTRVGQTPYSASARANQSSSSGRPRSPKAGNKQITRPRNKRFNIKKLIPQSRQIQVNKNGQRTMRVRKKAYYFNGNTRRMY